MASGLRGCDQVAPQRIGVNCHESSEGAHNGTYPLPEMAGTEPCQPESWNLAERLERDVDGR